MVLLWIAEITGTQKFDCLLQAEQIVVIQVNSHFYATIEAFSHLLTAVS